LDPQLPYGTLDDVVRWRAKEWDWGQNIIAVRYLWDELERLRPASLLGRQLVALGDEVRAAGRGGEAEVRPDSVMHRVAAFAPLGFALWGLRAQRDSEGYRQEVVQLAAGDDGAVLGHGFTLDSAGTLARLGFDIEFIPQTPGGEQQPDFLARRHGDTFTCEATTKNPTALRYENIGEFWRHLHRAVETKRTKYGRGGEWRKGVLLVDATPIIHLWGGLSSLPVVGEIVHMTPDHASGRPESVLRSGRAAMLSYEGPHGEGLRELEWLIRDYDIGSVMIWHRHLHRLPEGGVHRQSGFKVIGTMRGGSFWTHFEPALVFPGPGFRVTGMPGGDLAGCQIPPQPDQTL